MNKEIEALKIIFKELSLSELKFRNEKFEIEFKRNIPSDVLTGHQEQDKKDEALETDEGDKSEYYKMKSPIVGLFYSKSDPEEEPFVKIGSHIEKGETLCIIEAMKMFNEVKSPVSGVIRKINFNDEDFISADDVIFEIEEDND